MIVEVRGPIEKVQVLPCRQRNRGLHVLQRLRSTSFPTCDVGAQLAAATVAWRTAQQCLTGICLRSNARLRAASGFFGGLDP